MVQLKVQKIGDSLGLILPSEVLARLNCHEGENVFIAESPDGTLQLTGSEPSDEYKMALVKDIAGRYKNTLRELSK